MNATMQTIQARINAIYTEYTAIKDQSDVLTNKVILLNSQILDLQEQINKTGGDKAIKERYNILVRQCKQFNKQIRSNEVRMANLNRQMIVEKQRYAAQEQREIAKQQRAYARMLNGRSRKGYY